jgi:hypothetical protein
MECNHSPLFDLTKMHTVGAKGGGPGARSNGAAVPAPNTHGRDANGPTQHGRIVPVSRSPETSMHVGSPDVLQFPEG